MTGMSQVLGERPKGRVFFSTNLIATCKFYIARCERVEVIAKPWPDEQVVMQAGCMAVNQAYQVDELAKGSKVQKANVTLVRKLNG